MAVSLRGRSRRRAKTPAAPSPSDRKTRKTWLKQALTEAFGMDVCDADAIAKLVTDTFGRDLEVNDDTLKTQVRSIFYTLESKRILTFRRFEYQDPEGRTLRGFRWRLNPKFENEAPAAASDGQDDVYAQLPATVWKRGVKA